MLALYSGNFASETLGTLAPISFLLTASVYTLFNFATLIALWLRRNSPSTQALVIYLIIDIACITLLAGASGGINSGLPYLLIITVAAASIFLIRQLAIFIAALATVATLTESTVSSWLFASGPSTAFSSGTLGILLFATALLFQYLSQRLNESSKEADIQAEAAAKAIDVSQKIIERMRTGVLVADHRRQVLLINDAAKNLLGMDTAAEQIGNLNELPLVSEAFESWMQGLQLSKEPVKVASTSGEVRINFADLGTHNSSDTLIFVEDHRLLAQEAQKLKLGSLGKLTASIAHEVRNPLGAIAHAAQLLNEAPELTIDSKKLLSIILNHSKRVNEIIENTQQLSRRSQGQAEFVNLVNWLPQFIDDYCLTKSREFRPDIELHIASEPTTSINAKIDLNHLKQILTNLFDNGLRYSFSNTSQYHIGLRLGYRQNTELAYLQIIDDGPGVDKTMEDSIFEPFFTTENTGSGLGLYISRELCQSNQASLSYSPWQGKSCFQINFAHAQQVF